MIAWKKEFPLRLIPRIKYVIFESCARSMRFQRKSLILSVFSKKKFPFRKGQKERGKKERKNVEFLVQMIRKEEDDNSSKLFLSFHLPKKNNLSYIFMELMME